MLISQRWLYSLQISPNSEADGNVVSTQLTSENSLKSNGQLDFSNPQAVQ